MLRKHKRLTKKELKKDPLVIFIAQAVDFLKNEWLKIGSTILVVVLVISLAFFIVRGKKRSAVNAFDVAFTALNNNAPEALDLLRRVVEDYSGSIKAGEALIKLGNSYFLLKDYDSSEKYFKLYINKFSDDPIYAFNAYNSLGGIYEDKGDYLKAAETYENFINKFSNSVFLPKMFLSAGKAYYLSGDNNAAKRNFTNITNNFKDSKEKQEATYFLEILQ